ncbi:hypothetical protein [Avibacterium paragallinarum]|uniref:hypothetical protein n=1 Tax=Avibacterium paragallinarum TaxID=728 RepID=UPI0010293B2E|nr:hypothetical protein [Avibacterium paragallinarum]RZN56975.1 hypothetical protein EIG78_07855 [Avibacterium paragallinarum]
MRKNTVTQDFKQAFVLARFSELEALIYLLKSHIESQYSESDLTLVNGFNLLAERALMDLYRAITLELGLTDGNEGANND